MDTSHETNESVVAEVIDAEQRRIRALIERDWDALEQLLADDLSHTHLSGRTENKTVYLTGAQTRVHSPKRSGLSVQIFGEVAVMRGDMDFGTQGKGADASPLTGVVLQVWVQRDGRWQMLALQGTRTSAPT